MIPCHSEKPVTPSKEPIEPHSVTAMNVRTQTSHKKATAAYQPCSHPSANQKSPRVEAMPFPPRKRMVTGQMCPMMTNTPQT